MYGKFNLGYLGCWIIEVNGSLNFKWILCVGLVSKGMLRLLLIKEFLYLTKGRLWFRSYFVRRILFPLFCFPLQAGQDKQCKQLVGWTRHIMNHFWYAAEEAKTYNQFIVSSAKVSFYINEIRSTVAVQRKRNWVEMWLKILPQANIRKFSAVLLPSNQNEPTWKTLSDIVLPPAAAWQNVNFYVKSFLYDGHGSVSKLSCPSDRSWFYCLDCFYILPQKNVDLPTLSLTVMENSWVGKCK